MSLASRVVTVFRGSGNNCAIHHVLFARFFFVIFFYRLYWIRHVVRGCSRHLATLALSLSRSLLVTRWTCECDTCCPDTWNERAISQPLTRRARKKEMWVTDDRSYLIDEILAREVEAMPSNWTAMCVKASFKHSFIHSSKWLRYEQFNCLQLYVCVCVCVGRWQWDCEYGCRRVSSLKHFTVIRARAKKFIFTLNGIFCRHSC